MGGECWRVVRGVLLGDLFVIIWISDCRLVCSFVRLFTRIHVDRVLSFPSLLLSVINSILCLLMLTRGNLLDYEG